MSTSSTAAITPVPSISPRSAINGICVPTNNPGQAGAYAETVSGSGYGFVYAAVITNGGFGYGNSPRVSFIGGGGSGASGYSVSNGVLTGITVTNAGSDYSGQPIVVIIRPTESSSARPTAF